MIYGFKVTKDATGASSTIEYALVAAPNQHIAEVTLTTVVGSHRVSLEAMDAEEILCRCPYNSVVILK